MLPEETAEAPQRSQGCHRVVIVSEFDAPWKRKKGKSLVELSGLELLKSRLESYGEPVSE